MLLGRLIPKVSCFAPAADWSLQRQQQQQQQAEVRGTYVMSLAIGGGGVSYLVLRYEDVPLVRDTSKKVQNYVLFS